VASQQLVFFLGLGVDGGVERRLPRCAALAGHALLRVVCRRYVQLLTALRDRWQRLRVSSRGS